jgi:soluble lytic murein transglycosylase
MLGWGVGSLTGCRGDAAELAIPPAGGPEAGAAAASAGAAAAAGGAARVRPASPTRALWFDDGPGRAAILARERRDPDAAIALLDPLLEHDDLSPDVRGAAHLLRGLAAVDVRDAEAAARHFAAARVAPGLAAIEPRVRLLEAQAHLDRGAPAAAMALVADLQPRAPLDVTLWLVRADAAARTGDPAGAERDYEAALARVDDRRAHELRIKLARLLSAAGANRAALLRAIELYEAVALGVPVSEFGDEARTTLPALRKRAGAALRGRAAAAFERRLALARFEDLLRRRRYAAVVEEVDAWLVGAKPDDGERCQALFAQGQARFKQRERAEARTLYDKAVVACRKAADRDAPEATPARDRLVKASYQAARGRYAAGQFARAAKQFEAVAADFADHSYADDALVLAGESWLEAEELAAAQAAYRRVLERFADGDMAAEARRRLVVGHLIAGEFDAALALADGGVAHGDAGQRAKMHYFRARALAGLGRGEEAAQAWREVLRVEPLGYAALQALSRLKDAGDAPFRAALAELRSRGEAAPAPPIEPALDGTDASQALTRARLLASLGMGEAAREELDAAAIGGWPAVALLDQAGAHPEAQRLLANLDGRWREVPPGERSLPAWQLAHPRPFAELVEDGERALELPAELTYGVMQTESRFDAGVTSWAGARGLLQLMPSTARSVATSAGIDLAGADALFDPATNINLGQRHLAALIARYGGSGTASGAAAALAVPSYNAGAGAVERWLGERGALPLDLFLETIPYDETRAYAQRVLGRWFAYRWVYGGGAGSDLPYLPSKLPARGRIRQQPDGTEEEAPLPGADER